MGSQHHRAADGRLQISDAETLRLMANPTRLRIVDFLYARQTAHTATAIAQVIPMKPSAMSYHLRALGEHGVIERVDGHRDGRERPWRAVAAGYSLVASDDADAATRAWLLDSRIEPMRQRMTEVLKLRQVARQPVERDRYMVLATGELWLTPDEVSDAVRAIDAIWNRFEQLSQARSPEQGRLVRYMWSVLPDVPHAEQ